MSEIDADLMPVWIIPQGMIFVVFDPARCEHVAMGASILRRGKDQAWNTTLTSRRTQPLLGDQDPQLLRPTDSSPHQPGNRPIGKAQQPRHPYYTHSSEKARRQYRQYLHFVSLMEDERYNLAHLQAYAHSWPNP